MTEYWLSSNQGFCGMCNLRSGKWHAAGLGWGKGEAAHWDQTRAAFPPWFSARKSCWGAARAFSGSWEGWQGRKAQKWGKMFNHWSPIKSDALFLGPLFMGRHRPDHSPPCCVLISTLNFLHPTCIPKPSQKEQTSFSNPTLLGLALQKHVFFFLILLSTLVRTLIPYLMPQSCSPLSPTWFGIFGDCSYNQILSFSHLVSCLYTTVCSLGMVRGRGPAHNAKLIMVL